MMVAMSRAPSWWAAGGGHAGSNFFQCVNLAWKSGAQTVQGATLAILLYDSVASIIVETQQPEQVGTNPANLRKSTVGALDRRAKTPGFLIAASR
jgi:hypothetical protein